MDIRIMKYACNLVSNGLYVVTYIKDYDPKNGSGISLLANYEDKTLKKYVMSCLEDAKSTLTEYGIKCSKITEDSSTSSSLDISWNANKNRKISDEFWYCLHKDYVDSNNLFPFNFATREEQEKMIADWLEKEGLCKI